MNIFISGTEARVGKTFIASGLASLMQSLGYKSGVFKPVQCGANDKNGFLIAPDLAFVKRTDAFVDTACSYLLRTGGLPVLALEKENVKFEINKVLKDYAILKENCELVITEDSNGISTPLNSKFSMSDIAKNLKLPVVFVAVPDENTVNDTLLAVNYAKEQGLEVRGVIINKYPQGTDNIAIRTVPRLIEEYSDTKVLGIIRNIPDFRTLTPGVIIDIILNSADIEKIFGIKIPKLNSEV